MGSFSFRSRVDDWQIHGFNWLIDNPIGSVVIGHGMAEHSLRYQRFAEALNQAGFNVWSVDHRAHGKTLGPNGFGDFGEGGWDALVSDLDQLIDQVKDHQELAILFGHSMGAAASQQFAQTGSDKIAALVLSGSAARRPGAEIADRNAQFDPRRTEYDWLSRDEAEVDKYIEDPLCGFEGQTIRNGFNRTDTRRIDPKLIGNIRNDLPVLLVAGDADPVNDDLKALDYLEQLWREGGVQRIDKQYYEGGRHEMLNETNRDEVTRDIIDWMLAIINQ